RAKLLPFAEEARFCRVSHALRSRRGLLLRARVETLGRSPAGSGPRPRAGALVRRDRSSRSGRRRRPRPRIVPAQVWTVINTLQAMDRAGLVLRERSGRARRALVVALSEKGRALVPGARTTWAEIEQRTIGGLSGARLSALVQALAH